MRLFPQISRVYSLNNISVKCTDKDGSSTKAGVYTCKKYHSLWALIGLSYSSKNNLGSNIDDDVLTSCVATVLYMVILYICMRWKVTVSVCIKSQGIVALLHTCHNCYDHDRLKYSQCKLHKTCRIISCLWITQLAVVSFDNVWYVQHNNRLGKRSTGTAGQLSWFERLNSHACISKMFTMVLDIAIMSVAVYLKYAGHLFTKTSYRQISRSLEDAGLGVITTLSLWNLTDISAAHVLPMCLSNSKAIGKSLNPNLVAPRLHMILPWDVRPLSEYRPRVRGDTSYLGWCAVWLKSDLSPKLYMNKEELSQTFVKVWIQHSTPVLVIFTFRHSDILLQWSMCFVDARFAHLFKTKMTISLPYFIKTYSLIVEYPNITQTTTVRSQVECGLHCLAANKCQHYYYNGTDGTRHNCVILG